MGRFIGIDWAGGCWVVVDYDGEPRPSTEPTILNAWHRFKEDAETILVDIPIGLVEASRRDCDVKAREVAGSRSSSVFSVPVAGAVKARNYDDAKEANRQGGFNGLGSQSWGMVPRIREMSVFLEEHPEAGQKIYESHPEVCFAKLAGEGAEIPSKNDQNGRQKRLELMHREAPDFGAAIEGFVQDRLESPAWHQKIQSGRVTDVVDAAVLALTAKLATERGFPHVPADRSHNVPPVIIHP